MRLSEEKFLEKVNCCRNTLLQYLCRTEFSHIRRIPYKGKVKRTMMYYNVYPEDISALNFIIKKRKRGVNEV